MQPPMKKEQAQRGSAMVMALFILAILTLVGMLAARSTTVEVQMAANELHHREAFYAVEGVAEMVAELLDGCFVDLDGDHLGAEFAQQAGAAPGGSGADVQRPQSGTDKLAKNQSLNRIAGLVAKNVAAGLRRVIHGWSTWGSAAARAAASAGARASTCGGSIMLLWLPGMSTTRRLGISSAQPRWSSMWA